MEKKYLKYKELSPPWHIEIHPAYLIEIGKEIGEKKYGITLVSEMGYNVNAYPYAHRRELFDTPELAEQFWHEHQEEIDEWIGWMETA